VKRAILLLATLVLVAAGAAAAYQAAARQRDYRARLAQGDAALHDDQTFAAIEAYSGAIALRPESMLGHLRRAETYQRRADPGDLDLAARDFRRAAALDQTATRPLEELGDVLYQRQRYARAAEAYERYARLDDRSARITYKLALARFRSGDVEGAMSSLRDTVRLDDRMADAYYLLGVCLRNRSRQPEALTALEKAVALSPGLIAAREELADLYGSVGRPADELAQLQVLAGLDRTNVERQVAIGLAHARAHRWELAVLTLGSALERTPDNPSIYGALGQVWLQSAQARNDRVDLSKAREALERVASMPAATSEILALYGRALLEEGDIEGAERALLAATTRYPVDPASLLLYASAAERQNHLDAARAALIQYGALVSNDTDLVARTGRIAALSLRLNEPDVAATWLRQAHAASPNDLRVTAALADALLRAGDQPGAQAAIAGGLEKDPKNVQLLTLSRRVTRQP
jgi:tetratricopeptide (TPR) repeat protein